MGVWFLLLGVAVSMANPVLTVISNGACDNAVDKPTIHNRLSTIKCNLGQWFVGFAKIFTLIYIKLRR